MDQKTNSTETIFTKFSHWMKTSISLKLLTIGILVLLLQIPSAMIKDLIRERKYENEDVGREISAKWGGEQDIAGPVLSIPFYMKNDTAKKNLYYMNLLPDQLDIKGDLDVEIKHRGIYNAPVYKGDLNYLGNFDFTDLKKSEITKRDFLWDETILSVGIPDMRGIQERVKVGIAGKVLEMNPGLKNKYVFKSGVSNSIKINPEKDKINFNFDLAINGSDRVAFYPIGKETNVNVASNWPDPSFNGSFLPDTHSIAKNGEGFVADWKVLNLNRNYPQYWVNGTHSLSQSDFGVEFKILADHYQKTTRSSKYSNMFIFLTFLIFFFIEVISKIRIHAIQYLLVGIGLTIFYSLLLSISEHFNFQFAYLVSAIGIGGLISSYIHAIFKKWKLTLVLFSSLSALYLFLYVTLQLESYSLLIGSIGIFIILGIVMFASRKVKWIKENND